MDNIELRYDQLYLFITSTFTDLSFIWYRVKRKSRVLTSAFGNEKQYKSYNNTDIHSQLLTDLPKDGVGLLIKRAFCMGDRIPQSSVVALRQCMCPSTVSYSSADMQQIWVELYTLLQSPNFAQ